jgi:hypothetical protein
MAVTHVAAVNYFPASFCSIIMVKRVLAFYEGRRLDRYIY